VFEIIIILLYIYKMIIDWHNVIEKIIKIFTCVKVEEEDPDIVFFRIHNEYRTPSPSP